MSRSWKYGLRRCGIAAIEDGIDEGSSENSESDRDERSNSPCSKLFKIRQVGKESDEERKLKEAGEIIGNGIKGGSPSAWQREHGLGHIPLFPGSPGGGMLDQHSSILTIPRLGSLRTLPTFGDPLQHEAGPVPSGHHHKARGEAASILGILLALCSCQSWPLNFQPVPVQGAQYAVCGLKVRSQVVHQHAALYNGSTVNDEVGEGDERLCHRCDRTTRRHAVLDVLIVAIRSLRGLRYQRVPLYRLLVGREVPDDLIRLRQVMVVVDDRRKTIRIVNVPMRTVGLQCSNAGRGSTQLAQFLRADRNTVSVDALGTWDRAIWNTLVFLKV
ncbi:hypothetical protein J6590_069159 [Homalodisca vitripennis]|nr:hypothetical protein J6590_069159 [Homalodisca vitripennis]